MQLRCLVVFLIFLSICCSVSAYTCNTDQKGPLTLSFEKMEKITQFNVPQEVRVSLKNDADTSITVHLFAQTIDTVKIVDPSQ